MESAYIDMIMARLPAKVDRMIEQLEGKSPHATNHQGVYESVRTDDWTSGFWPGILWIMHDLTGKAHYKEAAWGWDEEIEQWFNNASNDLHHDVGFQFLSTAVIKHKLTGDEAALHRGLRAANFLAGRFNPLGNFIRAWNGDHYGWAIVDCMMNIPLLFWASQVTGDPRYKHIAVRHADTTMKYFIREDGSVHHIISFDAESGEFIEALGGQGAGPDSAWSRGNAWAIYGFAVAYRYTGDMRYLHAAKRVAHFFCASLPEDHVPYWDFRLDTTAGEPRDSSAAAIAASGMLEIAEHVSTIESQLYVKQAKAMLHSLSESYTAWDDPEYEGIITHSTANKPAGNAIDVSLIYGDYYYVEVMAKLSGWKQRIY